MSRPVEATSALDLDTIKTILWASESGSGHPNVSRLYDVEAADGLPISRGTFFNAVKGRRVTSQVIDAIDELIAIRGWRAKYIEHCREEHKQRVIRAFENPKTYCSMCGHHCAHCGEPRSEKRRKAVSDFLKHDPVELGCRVREPATQREE
jgi:ribosomal protein L37E